MFIHNHNIQVFRPLTLQEDSSIIGFTHDYLSQAVASQCILSELADNLVHFCPTPHESEEDEEIFWPDSISIQDGIESSPAKAVSAKSGTDNSSAKKNTPKKGEPPSTLPFLKPQIKSRSIKRSSL